MFYPNDPRQYTARQQGNQHQHRQYDIRPNPSRIPTILTIRNTHNIIETTHLLCMIQMILDSTLLVSKIISINIVSMIKARTNLIYNTLDSTRLTRIMINGTDLDLSIVFIFQQVRDIKFFMVNARLMQTRIFKPNVT